MVHDDDDGGGGVSMVEVGIMLPLLLLLLLLLVVLLQCLPPRDQIDSLPSRGNVASQRTCRMHSPKRLRIRCERRRHFLSFLCYCCLSPCLLVLLLGILCGLASALWLVGG